MRERKKQIKEQALQDDSSSVQAKAAIHDSIHGLKFVPDDEVKSVATKEGARRASSPSSASALPLAAPRRTRSAL